MPRSDGKIAPCFPQWRNVVIDCAGTSGDGVLCTGIQPWLDNRPHLWFPGFSGLIPSRPQVVAEQAR